MIIDHDQEDWERLYRCSYPSVYRALVAALLDSDLAADALQDAFVAGLERPPAHDGNVAGWLFRVAIRKAGRARRRRMLALDNGTMSPERDQIAALLGIRRGTVAATISQALARMRKGEGHVR